jgi:hypothetical protein
LFLQKEVFRIGMLLGLSHPKGHLWRVIGQTEGMNSRRNNVFWWEKMVGKC